MNPLIYPLLSASFITLLSVVGILTLAIGEKKLKKVIMVFVSFSAGALLGGAFFHLLPEAIEEFGEPLEIFKYVIVGISLFFILERVFRWHHCHQLGCQTHKHLGYLNLIGDSVHNMIDGIVIISAFTVNPALGLPVVFSIALHEVPQELGDFAVLIYSGFKKTKALLYNLFSASTVILGVLLGYLLIDRISNINFFLLPFAAGGFIYIATSDLIPEIHKEENVKKSLLSFISFILALGLMLLLSH